MPPPFRNPNRLLRRLDFKERAVKWSLHSASYLALRFNCDVDVVRWIGGVASEARTNGVMAAISAVTLLLVCELWTLRLTDPVRKNNAIEVKMKKQAEII
ncbi:hypothetical protein TNCV_189221 [Trichonephila clavipes]|nr:hypothetical protein TNCV_189221 [Trichonephila clavipes]